MSTRIKGYVCGRRCYDCQHMYSVWDFYDGGLMGCDKRHWLGTTHIKSPADLRDVLTKAERCDDFEPREEAKP